MMLPSTVEWLRDIVREAEFLRSQSEKTTQELFLADEVLKRAFVRSVEIIGEAAKKVPVGCAPVPLACARLADVPARRSRNYRAEAQSARRRTHKIHLKSGIIFLGLCAL